MRMAGSRSLTLIFQVVALVILLLLNITFVEARRGSSGYHSRKTNYGGSNRAISRGKDPFPWWVITLIFVGGILGFFVCVMGLRKFYEKKRQQKIRAMLSRRSVNLGERRRSARDRSNTTSGVPQGSPEAPPSYEQSAMDDAQPPAYSKDVNTEDEHTLPPPTPQDTSVPMDTTLPVAPPSYDAAQNDGSEVVEVGGAVTMEMNTTDGGNTHSDQTNVDV